MFVDNGNAKKRRTESTLPAETVRKAESPRAEIVRKAELPGRSGANENRTLSESMDALLALDAMETRKESSFGKRLKEALGDRTISSFAEEMNLSKQIISAYIHEKRKPKDATLCVMAELLNVNVGWLLGYNVPREPEETDKFVKVSEIPSYVRDMLESDESMVSFLSAMFSEEELDLLLAYRNLSDEGRTYIMKTMELTKSFYY